MNKKFPESKNIDWNNFNFENIKNKKMNIQERKNRILARGEITDHSHIIVGDATVIRNNNCEILVSLGNEECILKHIIESAWLENESEIWTKEHGDVNLSENNDNVKVGQYICRHGDVALKKVDDKTYQYIQQKVYDPLSKRIEEAKD